MVYILRGHAHAPVAGVLGIVSMTSADRRLPCRGPRPPSVVRAQSLTIRNSRYTPAPRLPAIVPLAERSRDDQAGRKRRWRRVELTRPPGRRAELFIRRCRYRLCRRVVLVATMLSAPTADAQNGNGEPPAATASEPSPGSQPARTPLLPTQPATAPPPPALPSTVSSMQPLNHARARPEGVPPAPTAGEMTGADEAFGETWWAHARPVIELHGYFRTRGELFQNFFLGRHNSSVASGGDSQYLWPIPLDQSYQTTNGNGGQTVAVCGSKGTSNCYDKTESSANLRLRLNPEIQISDNLRARGRTTRPINRGCADG